MSKDEALIVEHYAGTSVRFAMDQWEAEALAAKPDGGVIIVRQWITSDSDHIAWVVGHKVERAIIMDQEARTSWEWEMDGYADEDGFLLFVFKWIDDHLVSVYMGDHHVYITSIEDRKVIVRTIHGDAVRVFMDRITSQVYGPDEPPIRTFLLPRLEELGTMSMSEAKERGMAPVGLDLVYHPDRNPYPLRAMESSDGA